MNNRILVLPVIGVTAFFTLLLVYTRLFGPIPFSVNSITTQKSTAFEVTGEGKVVVQPDMANISVGILAYGATVEEVQEQINSVINKVSQTVKESGVDAKDIQSTDYSINPDYDFSTGRRIKGYSASANLSVRVRQIDKINQVIDAATAKGANQVNYINFDVDDRKKWENEAREKGVEEAKRKAQDAAKVAGFKLGRIINYWENFGGFPGPISMMQSGDSAATATPTQVEPGTTDIIVNVTLSYEIQ